MPIFTAKGDFTGVHLAAQDLQKDVRRVSGVDAQLTMADTASGEFVILAGTLGKNPLIDSLAASGKLDVSSIKGKWESFVLQTIDRPAPGIGRALVIAGSDQRGAIYGIYEVSEQIGVSPWYWWADVVPQHRDTLYVKPVRYVQGPPVVKYRGIFINDEDPAFGGWSREKFGGVNSKAYVHVFELLLRMRANYLWPAMWGKAFNEDDPADARLANDYGIVMGTSHHEPMLRAQSEWGHHKQDYGNGEWNYQTNKQGLQNFWRDGVVRNKNYESVYTLGMRGDGDVAMPDAGGLEANKKLLEQIIHDQQQILAANVNPDVTKLPQLWAIFTEVQKYYDAGLKVPDDVTLLFTDDNVGNLRRVPTPAERKRSGGAGIYYHMDMNGGPFSYKWLNSNPLPKVWEQMNLAYRYGADRIWIVNVGDIKPLEVPIEFFLRMAWNPAAFGPDTQQTYLIRWATREFGAEHSTEIADLMAAYPKLNASPKPELVHPDTFSLLHYREAERVWDAWSELGARAQRVSDALRPEQRDAFYELVLHPILACGNAVQLNIAAGRNSLFLQQGRASASDEAALVRSRFALDQHYSDFYNHTLLDGKWDHMMDQTHIGYTTWSSPKTNNMPTVHEATFAADNSFGVAVEGMSAAWPAAEHLPLTEFDSLERGASYFEVFPRGAQTPELTVTAAEPWILLHSGPAFSAGKSDRRYWVDVDWNALPSGISSGSITVKGAGATATVTIRARKATKKQAADANGAFGSLSGPFAFDATSFSSNMPLHGVHWGEIVDYGRESSAMAVFPVDARSIASRDPRPALEYPVYLGENGAYTVDIVTNPTLDLYPGRPLALALSIDGEPAQVVSVYTPETKEAETFLGKDFYRNTRTNARILHFYIKIAQPGRHTMKLDMVDPTMVVEKIVWHKDPLPPSFFGPLAEPSRLHATDAPASKP